MTCSPSTLIYRAWIASMRTEQGSKGTLAQEGFEQVRLSHKVKVSGGGQRTPDILISGPHVECPLVVEVKDTNGIADHQQALDLGKLELSSLRQTITCDGDRYQPMYSCLQRRHAGIRSALDACGCSRIPVARVADDGIMAEDGHIDSALRSAFESGVRYPYATLDEIPAEYLRFCPEAADEELALWVMTALQEFAYQHRPPFTLAEVAQAAAALTWETLGNPARDELVGAVRRLLRESSQNQLKGYLKPCTPDYSRWELISDAILGARTGEVKSAFVESSRKYVRWKESALGSQEELFSSG